jgi:hypothetical protein
MRLMLGYRRRTMPSKRTGKTVKVSVSLPREDLATLRREANLLHDGNPSAAFAAAARWIRQREARRHVLELLGGPSLTPDAAAAIDDEQRTPLAKVPRKARTPRAARST